MIRISTVVITFNEEENIGRCIDSVKEISDEILIVDSFSTDKTREIAESKGAKSIQNKFEGHIEQKNYALKQAKYDHVLSLDADEALSSEACSVIKKIKSSEKFKNYRLNRLTNYCGRWIHHCGWYPDKKTRLVDRRHAYWGGVNPHDKLIVENSNPVDLNVDILHYSFPTIDSHINTANNFSDIAAKQIVEKGRRVNFFIHVVLNPIYTFVKKYFLQLGVLDGYYGFIVCGLSSYSSFLKYVKTWRLQSENTDIQN